MTYIRPVLYYYFWLAFAAILCAFITSCAQMGANDGLVPQMSAQSNLPYIPAASVSGRLGAPERASSGMMVAPLADTRRAFWQ